MEVPARRPAPLLFGLLAVTAASLAAGLALGSLPLGVDQLFDALSGRGDPLLARIVTELRLPRVLAAFAVGGLLALSGVLMQVLLRNPLADPYVLGTSGGAAVAALGLMLLGLSGWVINLGAFAGALGAVLLVFALAGPERRGDPTRMLLTGIILAAGWGALIAFLLTLSPPGRVQGMLFWLMGDLAQAWQPGAALWLLLLLTVAGLLLARPIDLMVRGDRSAAALGVPVTRLRPLLYLIASAATATAVGLAGSVGFIGLIVPHLLRLAGARGHRLLLPASVLGGGSLLVLADAAARNLMAPMQLPVGILTALIGVPLFLFLLLRSRSC